MNWRTLAVLTGVAWALGAACDVPEERGGEFSVRSACLGSGAGLIGLNWADVGGTPDIIGPHASVMSNGRVRVYGDASVDGDALSATEVDAKAGSVKGSIVEGVDEVVVDDPTDLVLSFKDVNDNATFSPPISGDKILGLADASLTMNTGNYYLEEVRINGTTVLRYSGHVVVYLNGPFTTNGSSRIQAATTDTSAHSFTIISASDEDIRINGTSESTMHIFAPLARVTLSGTAGFRGTALGKELVLSGTSDVVVTDDLGDLWGLKCASEIPGDLPDNLPD